MTAKAPASRMVLEKLIDPVQAFAMYHYLDAHGVRVTMGERPLRAALGEIPYLEMPFTLYLDDPGQLSRARELVERYREGPGPIRGTIWSCLQCGEEHEPEFGACWNCGTARA